VKELHQVNHVAVYARLDVYNRKLNAELLR